MATGLPYKSQTVVTPPTQAAVFLVLTINPGADSESKVRSLCANLPGLLRAVGFRDPEARLSAVLGFGSEAWDRLFGNPRPRELHLFPEIKAGSRHAVATPGDILIHIRAARSDMCFELETQIIANLGDAVTTADEVHGFRYFDDRDLLGFVDGTENPVDAEANDVVYVGDEDPDFSGGSYVIVQKYLHDMAGWQALPVETQERIIGRRKLSDIELDDTEKPSFAHNALTNIVENGKELKIVRAGMVFGRPGQREFGIYFIAYSRSPAITEKMLHNMFVGLPPGNYDRLLDFSRAVTGSLFFVPSATFLDSVTPEGLSDSPEPPQAPTGSGHSVERAGDGSLRIGSLKAGPK